MPVPSIAAPQLTGGNLVLQRVSKHMFAALTPCKRSYGDAHAGFECACLYSHRHIVIDESTDSRSRVTIVPLPIESVMLLEEVAKSLLSRQFFSQSEFEVFLRNDRKVACRQLQTNNESRLRLRRNFSTLMNPVEINATRPD